MNKRNDYKKGLWAERIAIIFLMLKGYKILKNRYKTPVGEVDVVAKKRNVLVFVEVKRRPNYEQGILSISSVSQKRIMRAAEHYLMMEKLGNSIDMRFDAIIISPPFSIKHLVHAWTS
ncbi:MAG: YraN family protein [Alphaproteobacteria bacterium]|nr:YraN family protein [Alphaproteobacteria bacterium]